MAAGPGRNGPIGRHGDQAGTATVPEMSKILGHYAPGLLSALICLLIVLTLAPTVTSHVPGLVLLGLLVVVLLLAYSVFAHNRRLCERCIASLPLDASTVAARHAVRFRIAHLFERKRYALCYLAALVAGSLLYSHPIGRYGWAAAQASLIYLLLVYTTHQRLQPWCPQCGNGGHERTASTAPTPITTGV